MDNLNQEILRHLSPEKWIHIKDLATMLNLQNSNEVREMRNAITEMRHKGIHILSSSRGYKLAINIQEIQEARKYYLKYVKSLCINLRDLKIMERNYTGQLPMVF